MKIIDMMKEISVLEALKIEKPELVSILKNEMKKIENEIDSLQIINRLYQMKINSLEVKDTLEIRPNTSIDPNVISNLPSFELKKAIYIGDQYIDDSTKKEPTIEGLNIEEIIKAYNHPFPPQPLTDPILNKQVLELGLQNELLLFFRFFTHPFHQDFDSTEVKYLYYIMCEREISPSLMKYLLMGTEGEKIDFEEMIEEYENIDLNDLFSEVSIVEEYIDQLAITLEEDKTSDINRFKFVLENKEISIVVIPKKTLFKKDNTLKYFTDYMRKYGFFHKVILEP
jgi:hypothetical protein